MNANYTEETCTGTGDVLTLTGVTSGNLLFSKSFSDGDQVRYSVEDSGGSIKVSGVGVYSSGTITRSDTWNYDGVDANDLPGSNITLSGGTHIIRCGLQAKDADRLDNINTGALGITPDTIAVDTVLTSASSGFQVVASGTVGDINITLPDATTITNSALAFIFENNGDGDLYIKDSDGSIVSRVSTATSIGVNLQDNSSTAGVWSSFGFNTGTTESASAIAVMGTSTLEPVNASYAGLTMLTPTIGVVVLDSDTVKAFVIEVSGNTVTAATPINLTTTTAVYEIDLLRISDTQAMLVYSDNSAAKVTAMVLDVSGTTLTQGPEYLIAAVYGQGSAIAQLTANTVILSWVENAASTFIKAVVLTITGNVITAGAEVSVVESGTGSDSAFEITALTPTKALLYFSWGTVTNKPGACSVLDIAGTVITVTPPVLLGTPNFPYHATLKRLTDTTALLTHNDQNNSTIGLAYVITVTGTTFVKGASINFGSFGSYVDIHTTLFSPTKAVAAYKNQTRNISSCVVLNISGDVVTAEAEVDLTTSSSSGDAIYAVDTVSASKALVVFEDETDFDYTKATMLENGYWQAY